MRAKRKLFYGWVIVGITFLIMSIVYTIWYSFPLFYVPILDEFGWSRAKTALIFSIGSIVYGIGSAIGGALLDRFGPRRTFSFAAVITVIGLVGCSRVTEIWQFFLFWGGFVSFGICTAGYVPCVALVSKWFTRRRATAVGIAQAGGRESFVLTPLIQSLLLTLGWRSTYLVLAGAAAVLITGPAQFLRHSPKDIGLFPDGGTGSEEQENMGGRSQKNRAIVNRGWAATDWTLLRALKEHRFWALFGIMITMATGYGIVMTHQVAFMVDVGFTAMFASFLLLIFGVASMSGRLCGFVSDVLGRELTFTLCCSVIILGFLMLLLTTDSSDAWLLYIYVICFGFFSGLNSPTYASAAADMFQGAHFGAILGFANIGYGLGTSIGAWLGGYIFDVLGGYSVAFALAMLMMGMAIISFWIASPSRIILVPGRL